MLVSSRLAALWLCLLPAQLLASELQVILRTDFPGGNVVVKKNEGASIQLAPDLRGGPAWFYWYFEAEASQPGIVEFLFASPPMLGVRGPAISRDGGKSWQWLGTEQVKFAPSAGDDKTKIRQDSFSFTFSEAKQKVRFAVGIPYLQSNLDEFLSQHKANPHLKRSTLTETRIGRRPVDLIQIGKPGADVKAVLVTARHHACEALASYVLEGLMREALSDSSAGVEFRKKYVLYAVPFVDKDGVELGDQGKNRPPHDHNRDYGKENLYPEIKAIQELADLKKVQFSLDLHCPYIRGDIHEAFHFVGLGLPHIKENLKEWTAWLKEERPQIAMTPLDLLVDPRKPNAENRKMNSHYFATRENAIFSVCLEIPYAQPLCPLDADLARAYGASLLKAWVRTNFISANVERERGTETHASFLDFRTTFVKTYKSKPAEAEESANSYLEAKTKPACYRVEANNLLALLRLQQKRYAEALRYADDAKKDVNATTYQRATSANLRVQIHSNDPKALPSEVESSLAECLRLPYLALDQQAKAFEQVAEYFLKKQDYEKALGYTQKQLEVAANYEKGKLLNRLATLYELLKQPAEALKSRVEAVKILRARLEPVPERSIFGALMTVDLFEALASIPTATLKEQRAAAEMVFKHEIVSAPLKEKVRQALAELEKKNGSVPAKEK